MCKMGEMRALILSAGFGTRLRPLTEITPKALIPLCNEPALNYTVRYLLRYGISQIGVNAHYHRDKVVRHVESLKAQGIKIDVRVEKNILGTGGGVKNFSDFLQKDTFVVINADIITDFPLVDALAFHRESGKIVTLVLTKDRRFNQVLLGRENRIVKIMDRPTQEGWTFTGIHIIEPEIFNHMPDDDVFNIIDLYRKLIKKGIDIMGYAFNDHYWYDIGTISSYLKVNRWLMGGKRLIKGEHSTVSPKAKIVNWAVVGNNCKIEDEAMISGSVIWDGVVIKKGTHVKNSIIGLRRVAEGLIKDMVY